jgi:hypothetical protein
MREILAEQTELFNEDRWPRKPWCTDDLATGIRPRSLKHALTRRYIQANPPHLRVWSIFDIDRPAGGLAWEDANLPPPAWAAVNKANGHAHLAWGLSAPVLVASPEMRQAPLRYLCAVEAGFRAKLEADGGYSGLITKNPAHPFWWVLKGPQTGYTLDYLADWVDLPKHLPKRKPEQVGLGRNVMLFDHVRLLAYRQIRKWKAERNFIYWLEYLNNRALERNGEFITPLDSRECWHVAKSVARWVWNRFDIVASDARFSMRQAARGMRGGIAKGQANEDKRASARLMAARGVSVRQIAEAIGVHRDTIYSWLSASKNLSE